MKSKKCKHEGCTNPVWSGGLCQSHIGKKPMKSKSSFKATAGFTTVKSGGRQSGKTLSQHRYALFMFLWKQRGSKSEVSGEKIYGEPSLVYLSSMRMSESLLAETSFIQTMTLI